MGLDYFQVHDSKGSEKELTTEIAPNKIVDRDDVELRTAFSLDAPPANPEPGDVWIDLQPDPDPGSAAPNSNPVDEQWNVLPEGVQRGLAADATGEVYQGQSTLLTSGLLDSGGRAIPNTYFEAATKSSAGDEEVTVHLYDVTAAADVGTVVVTGGGTRARSGDLSGSFTEGNELRVDWEVTTASATSGATFDAVMARIVRQY